jgi:hypothetical protein
MSKTTVLTLIQLINTLVSVAQSPLEVGLFAGSTTYQGDLAESHIEWKELNPSFGGFMRYHLNEKFKVKADVIYGRISGTDANAADLSLKNRGWSFSSHIIEIVASGEYHPWGRSREDNIGFFRRQISPYVGTGVGLSNFDPDVDVKNDIDNSKFPEPLATTSSLTFPLSAGVRFDFHKYFTATLEVGSRITFNDYLDGVSHTGNSKKNDVYVFGGIGISYFIGYEERFGF